MNIDFDQPAKHEGAPAPVRGVFGAAVERPLLWAYLLLITVAELVTSLVQPRTGLILHGFALAGVIIYGSFTPSSKVRSLALALSLAPLIRLLSLSLPLLRFPQTAWYPIVSTPL